MLGDGMQSVLLVGGVVLIVVGVLVGIAVAIVAIVRRQRAAGGTDGAAPRLAEIFGSSTAADETPFTLPPSATGSTPRAASVPAPFVAASPSGRPSPAPAETSQAGPAAPLAAPPPVGLPFVARPPRAAAPWGEILGGEPAEPTEYSTGSFAPPGIAHTPTVAPHPETRPQEIVDPTHELTTPPLGNPWVGTGPQPPAARHAISPTPVAPVAPPLPAAAPPPPASSAPVPAAPAAMSPVPASTGGPAAPAHSSSPDDDRTVVVRRDAPPAWLLVLDSGERLGIPADSVVLGRKPAPIEHGVPGVTIPDPTKTLSKVHARLDRAGEHWTITDLASTNGTSVIEAGGRERFLPSGGSEVLRGRFLLGEVGMVLIRNPEAHV